MKPLLLLLPLSLLLQLPFTTTSTTTTTTTTTTPPPPTPTCTPAVDTTYTSTDVASKGIMKLGIQLLQEFGAQKNMFISPYSIWSLLALVMVGAEGQTEVEMGKVLGVNDKEGVLSLMLDLSSSLENATASDGNVSLDTANRVYVQQDFTINKCQTELADLLVTLDLSQGIQAANTINEFINTTTRGLIPDMVSADKFTSDTRMVALNAIYFKGSWSHPFPKEYTSMKPFHVSPDTEPVPVETMFAPEIPVLIGYSDGLQSQVLRMNYSTGLFSMTILLPSEGEAGLNATITALNPTLLKEALTLGRHDLYDVYLPKFEIKSKFEDDLKMALQNLGMNDVFTTAANLSSFSEDLFVKHIGHKTFVTVDEEGTEAAAATDAFLVTKIRRVIRINRPFLFFIHDKDNLLFAGAHRSP